MRAISVAGLLAVLLTWGACAAEALERVDRAKAIARDRWPDSPCLYQERVRFAELEDDVLGQAFPHRCAVRMARRLGDYEFCTTLVHEFGHLAGLEHNDTDPFDIMWPAPVEVDFPACRAGAPVPRLTGYPHLRLAAARRAVPRGSRTCERETATEIRCRGAGRYYVVRLSRGAIRRRRVSYDAW